MNRYAPEIPFPPYAFVSPHWPHPHADARGHSHGRKAPPSAPLDPARPHESRDFLFGIDLFNYGYYWEAHEAWEGLWHAAGRRGLSAELLKGLMKLAAAGFKVRQGIAAGVRIHGERAARHFRAVREATAAARFAGIDVEELEARSRDVAARAASLRGDPARPVEVVFDWALRLDG